MIFAKNFITVTGPTTYSPLTQYVLGQDRLIEKLTVRVFDNDVMLWISEEDPPVWVDKDDREMQLELGFHTLVPVVPWTAFRFKSIAVSSRVTFRAYGSLVG